MSIEQMKWMVLVAGVMALAGFFAAHNFSNLQAPKVAFFGEVIRLPAERHCDIAKEACLAQQGQDFVSLQFLEAPQALRPFEVQVRLPSRYQADASEVLLEFSMLNMEMGTNRFHLKRMASGAWQGKVVLPVCVAGRSDWKVTLSAMTTKQMFVAEYLFNVENAR